MNKYAQIIFLSMALVGCQYNIPVSESSKPASESSKSKKGEVVYDENWDKPMSPLGTLDDENNLNTMAVKEEPTNLDRLGEIVTKYGPGDPFPESSPSVAEYRPQNA